MNTKTLSAACLIGVLSVTTGCVVELRQTLVQPPGIETPPADPTVQVVEEGAVWNGVVMVAPATIDEYVFIHGGWHYWNPTYHVWVHAVRPFGWHPPPGVRASTLHNWSEYRGVHPGPVARGQPEPHGPPPQHVVPATPARSGPEPAPAPLPPKTSPKKKPLPQPAP